MIDKLLQNIAPHHCYSCQIKGNVLCDSCIYNIANDAQNACINCRLPTSSGICNSCKLPFGRSWVIGAREGELAKVIGDFKWSRLRSAHSPLSDLLDIFLPILPSNTVVVPVPTISRHKRIRGYDHADLIARTFAETRGLSKRNFLKRKDNAIQHKANKAERRKQAENAFYCNKALDPSVPYLLLDDIITTGYTIKAATRVLKGAGAKEIWVAAIARQPLN